MTLATKNNAIIVKDGQLAENCGCCGGICVCDATAVTVSISADNFLRHLLLRNSFGAEARVSLGFIAAPSSGAHVLRKDTVAPEAGLSPSKWVSDAVPSPGQGRITAVVYRGDGNAPVRVTVGIPVWAWRTSGDTFKSLEEMQAESNAGGVAGQGFGTLVVELECDSQSGASRVFSLRHIADTAWSPDGSTIPLLACDFSKTNGFQSASAVWWEGRRLLKGDERLLSLGFSIVSDTRTGSNIVTLDGIDLDCCEDEPEGACCEGTTCTVKPQCQCQGAGKVFRGVGTVCTPNPCSLCDSPSISIGTTGTASGFYQRAFQTYECPDSSYSVPASGSGSLTFNDSYLNSLACSVSGATPKCSFFGSYTAQGGSSFQAILVFFTVGNEVRFSVQVQISTFGDAARTACDRTGLTPGNVGFAGGGVGVYEACSGAIGTVSASGGLVVDLQSVAPLQISGGGSYGFAARGGSITVSFNPLP
jgi:hypothetical protein